MKKFLIVNVSPRRMGTSAVLAEMCRDFLVKKAHQVTVISLYQNQNCPDKLLSSVADCEALILCGPSYIDTYPAETIWFLMLLSEHGTALHGQDLYGVIQGGMPYAHTHDSGLVMLECFGRRHNVQYKGGFAMGFGAMLNGQPVSKLPNAKKVQRQLDVFFHHIEKGEMSPPSVYLDAQMKLPAIVCRLMAALMNRHIDNGFRKQGIDPKAPNPYLE